MTRRQISHSAIEKVLGQLGFAASAPTASHKLFKHDGSGAIVILPLQGPDAAMPLHQLAAIRRTVVEKGVSDAATFDAMIGGYYPVAEWLIRLKGSASDLQELSKRLRSPKISVVREGASYYLKSADLNMLTDDAEVRARAASLVEAINGYVSIRLGYLQPIEVDSSEIVRIGEDGTRWASVGKSLTIRFRVKAPDTETIPVDACLALAEQELAVQDALRLLGNYPPSWFTLYKIYEIIKQDVGGIDGIEREGWSTKAEIKRFSRTANSKTVLGEAARHGVETGLSPANPMNLQEGIALIREMLRQWLAWKYAKQKRDVPANAWTEPSRAGE